MPNTGEKKELSRRHKPDNEELCTTKNADKSEHRATEC